VVNRISDLLTRLFRTYISKLEVSKTRLPYKCRVPLLRGIKVLVTLFVLRKIVAQLARIGENLEACSDIYTRYSELPYTYKLKARIESNAGVLKIKDIRPH